MIVTCIKHSGPHEHTLSCDAPIGYKGTVTLTVHYATRPTQSYKIDAASLPIALAACDAHGTADYRISVL